jgi:hypothetical protein
LCLLLYFVLLGSLTVVLCCLPLSENEFIYLSFLSMFVFILHITDLRSFSTTFFVLVVNFFFLILCRLLHLSVRHKTCPHYSSKATDAIACDLYISGEYQVKLCIASAFSSLMFLSELRPFNLFKVLSGFLFVHYYCNLSETLKDRSIP